MCLLVGGVSKSSGGDDRWSAALRSTFHKRRPPPPERTQCIGNEAGMVSPQPPALGRGTCVVHGFISLAESRRIYRQPEFKGMASFLILHSKVGQQLQEMSERQDQEESSIPSHPIDKKCEN